MKKIIYFTIAALAVAGIVQSSFAQVMLQKAVVSNGGGFASNGSTKALIIAGQTATGTASNGQITGHFGFFAAPSASIASVATAAGAINSVLLSPNPASNEVEINISLSNSTAIDLFLYDASGHLISTIYSGKKDACPFRQKLDTKSLSSGMYFIAARIPGALVQAKLNVVK
jgi:hypothetical protein